MSSGPNINKNLDMAVCLQPNQLLRLKFSEILMTESNSEHTGCMTTSKEMGARKHLFLQRAQTVAYSCP